MLHSKKMEKSLHKKMIVKISHILPLTMWDVDIEKTNQLQNFFENRFFEYKSIPIQLQPEFGYRKIYKEYTSPNSIISLYIINKKTQSHFLTNNVSLM